MTKLDKFNSLNKVEQRAIENQAQYRLDVLLASNTYGKWASENQERLLDKFKEFYSYQSPETIANLVEKDNQRNVDLAFNAKEYRKEYQTKVKRVAEKLDEGRLEYNTRLVIEQIKSSKEK